MANNIEVGLAPRASEAETDNGAHEDMLEGGKSAWLTVTGSFLVYFSSFGMMNSFGYFQEFYQSNYLRNDAPSEIAFIGTLQIGLMYLTSPVVGSLFDAYGTNRLYPVGGLGCTVSMILLSVTTPNHIWQQFLTQGLLFALTVSFGVQPALTMVAQRFRRRRALAIGVVVAGSSAGGVCLPLMFADLVPRIGFAWSTRIAALIILVCYCTAFCITRSRMPSKPLRSIGDLFDYGGFKDPRYVFLALGAFLVNLGLYAPYYYAQPYCALLDPHTNIKQYLLPLLNASSLFGRVIGGYIADQIGRLNLLWPLTLLAGVLGLVMWLLAPDPTVVAVFASLYGFCSGVFISTLPAVTSQILPADKLGARLGALPSVTALGVFSGNPIAGALQTADTVEGYRPLIIYSGSTIMGGAALLFVARILHATDMRAKW